MTAVVCFVHNKNPIVLGDLLVSGDPEDAAVSLPTTMDVSSLFPLETEAVPRDLLQKVSVLSDRLVIGWSGNRQLACDAISYLYHGEKTGGLTFGLLAI